MAELPPGKCSDFAEAGYRAVYLLQENIPRDPDLCAALSASWVPALIYHIGNGSSDHLEITRLAYEIAPAVATDCMLRDIEHASKGESGLTMALQPFKLCWCQALSEAVTGFIATRPLKTETLACVLDDLLEFDRLSGLLTASGILKKYPPFENTCAVQDARAVALCRLLACGVPDFWKEISETLVSEPDLSEVAFLALASQHRHASVFSAGYTEVQLADVYLALLRLFPNKTDPEIEPGEAYTPDARMNVTDLKRLVLDNLTARGNASACAELLRIAKAAPSEDQIWILWKHKDAQDALRRGAWQKVEPQTLLSLVGRADARLVRNEDDLLELVCESLERFQTRLTRSINPTVVRLWNYEGAGTRRHSYSPKDEEDLSNEIASWLEDDLGAERGLVLNREVQLRPGQRSDILVDAVARNQNNESRLTVVIEVKGCWNDKVQTAATTQLVEDYLAKNGLTHGLYVVGWFMCPRWDHPQRQPRNHLASQDFNTAGGEVARYTIGYEGRSTPYTARGLLLDCRYPVNSRQ